MFKKKNKKYRNGELYLAACSQVVLVSSDGCIDAPMISPPEVKNAGASRHTHGWRLNTVHKLQIWKNPFSVLNF